MSHGVHRFDDNLRAVFQFDGFPTHQGDGGIVVQTESDFSGVAFAYDDSESRWGFQQGTKLAGTATAAAPDAYASAVVTSDDSNYQKNGNIRVQGGEIYIYVE